MHHRGGPGWRYGHGGYGSWSMSLHYLNSSFGGQLIAVAFILVGAVAAALAVRRRRQWIFGLRPAATCLALGSLLAIGIATLTPRSNAWAGGTVNLIPFHTVAGYLHQPADLLIYVGGNVALFAPLGFFVYLALGDRGPDGPVRGTGPLGRRVLYSTAACTLVSASVEILQLHIWSRSSDVDDVLTNALGGLIGALAGFAVVRLARRRRPAPDADGDGDEPDEPVYAVGSRAS